MGQLNALLSGGQQDPDELAREQTFDRFDSVCDAERLTPAKLGQASDAQLTEWITRQLPEKHRARGVNLPAVRRLLAEYVVACQP